MRTFDIATVDRAIAQVKSELKGQPVSDWLACPFNIALTNESGDVALFEYRQPGVYTGHYFFLSRGRQALSAAEEFLIEAGSEGVRIIIGFTPRRKKGACWITRQLGFDILPDAVINDEQHMISVKHL